VPLPLQQLASGRAVSLSEGVGDSRVLKGRKTHSATPLEIAVQVAPQAPTQGPYETEQAAVGAGFEEDPVEFVVQLDAGGDISPGLLQTVDYSGQSLLLGGAGLRLLQRERLESG
jgi:hypothetical protein